MRDKVREELIMLLLDSEILCNECGENAPTYCAEAIADYLMAHDVGFVTDNNDGCKWIPVTERLPENKQRVLVRMIDGTMDVWEYQNYGIGWWQSAIWKYRTEAITHWMPLPEAPKDGE